jgi:cyanophycinase
LGHVIDFRDEYESVCLVSGLIGLVGSGEYLPSMLEVERRLIEGRSPIYVQIPTAATLESPSRLRYWLELGEQQARRLGVEPVPIVIRDRSEANDPELIAPIAEAGLVYFSGGSPTHLIETIKDTLLSTVLFKAFENGTSVAGCSAGAMALGAYSPGLRHLPPRLIEGIGLVKGIAIVPHFDKVRNRITSSIFRHEARLMPSVTLVGVDEETALVGDGITFEVMGRGCAWKILGDEMIKICEGESLTLQ